MQKIYILVGVLSFLLALLTQLPASVAWQWYQSDAAEEGFYLQGIHGTVSEGHARQALYQSLPIDQPHWEGSVFTLLFANIRLSITGSLGEYPFNTLLSLSPWGGTRLKSTQGAIDIRELIPLLGIPFAPLEGMVVFDLSRIDPGENRIDFASGRAELRNAKWTLMKPQLALGTLRAVIDTEDGAIKATISSEGPLLLEGECNLLEDNSYSADIRLKAASGADPRLENLLKTLGNPSDGWYRITQKGQLPG